MVVTVDELKEHLRIQHDDENVYIFSLCEKAQTAAEDYCRASFDSDAPGPVQLAVMLMASYFYENRDTPDKQTYLAMRMAFEALLYPYRDESRLF